MTWKNFKPHFSNPEPVLNDYIFNVMNAGWYSR